MRVRIRRPVGNRVRAACIAAFLAAAASPATGATLPFEAELRIQINGTGQTIQGSGTATVNGSGGLGHLASLALGSGVVATTGLVMPITDPAANPIQGFQLTAANPAATFARTTGGALRGVMPLIGVWNICLFGPCSAALANLTVPLSAVGAPSGVATAPGAVNVTVLGASWTTGTPTFPVSFGLGRTETTMLAGYARGPASAPSSTALPGGTLLLVTPVVFSTSIAADGPPLGFASLRITFVPEPATALLLGVGIATVTAIARRRGRPPDG